MVKVDSEGRITIPKELRECLGLVPGTTVEIRLEDDKMVIELEDDPERILERMDELIEEVANNRQDTKAFGKHDPLLMDFREKIREQAQKSDSEEENK
ncbi:AbrB/MazE/SpoVT family DNA-binding domain-containing protein [Haloferax profundi]|nr:AbrB/MazE/SpoVT family DNA-binding domain-containing protein [Haloferax profundi]